MTTVPCVPVKLSAWSQWEVRWVFWVSLVLSIRRRRSQEEVTMPDTDFAVVIGISHYPGLRKPVQGAVRDADRFIDWLKGPAGVPDNQIHIKRLVSKDPPDPGMNPVITEIDDAFEKVFDQVENRQAGNVAPRRLYVYFAGHGCRRR